MPHDPDPNRPVPDTADVDVELEHDVDLGAVDLTDLDRFAGGFPHHVFRTLRRDAPVWWHPPTTHTPDGEGFWVVSRHADVVAVAGAAELFSSADGAGGRDGGGTLIEDLPAQFAAGVLLNMMDDPRHQQIRKLLTPAVSTRALATLEGDLRARSVAIVDEAVGRGSVDFLLDVAAELPLQAIARLLGVPQADRHDLFAWAEATLDYDDRELGQAGERSAAAAAAMFAYGAALVERRRTDPGDDLVSTLVHARIPGAGAPGEDEPLTDLELQMFFNLLIAAGSETTRNSIAIGALALVAHPQQWAALRADRSRVPAAVEELLRWSSVTTYNRRTARRDTEIAGVPVRAGDKVTLWWPSANRDDDVFDDPFRFDIGRTPNRHLAFGQGSHFCLGASLARLEMRVLLEALLERVDTIEVTGAPEWVRSNKHTGLRHLPVRLHAAARATGPDRTDG